MAKVPFLSDAWLDLHRALGEGLPERSGATARVQHIVSGSPDGEVRYVHTVVDGRTTEMAFGADDGADVTFTNTYADAQALARGSSTHGCCSCKVARRWPATWARCSPSCR